MHVNAAFEILCFHGQEASLHMKHRGHSTGSMLVGVHNYKVKTADTAANHTSV